MFASSKVYNNPHRGESGWWTLRPFEIFVDELLTASLQPSREAPDGTQKTLVESETLEFFLSDDETSSKAGKDGSEAEMFTRWLEEPLKEGSYVVCGGYQFLGLEMGGSSKQDK